MLDITRIRALIVLAAVALPVYGVASGVFDPGATASQAQDASIQFEVLLPADAVLEIQGARMTPTGAVRRFQTPPLRAGVNDTYTIKATHQGKVVTRDLHVTHEMNNALDLRPDFATAARVRTAVAAKLAPLWDGNVQGGW